MGLRVHPGRSETQLMKVQEKAEGCRMFIVFRRHGVKSSRVRVLGVWGLVSRKGRLGGVPFSVRRNMNPKPLNF